MCQDVSGCVRLCQDESGCVKMYQDVSGYVRICQDVSGCVKQGKPRKEGMKVSSVPKGKRFVNREGLKQVSLIMVCLNV